MLKNTIQRLMAAILIMGMIVPPTGSARELAGEVEASALPTSSGLYRTRVAVRQSADWARLERVGVTVLEQGEDWALVLADADQLETLARLRFEPQNTDELGMLVAAHAQAKPWLAASLRPLLQAWKEHGLSELTDQPLGQDSESANSAHPALTPELKAGLSSLSSVDDDADSLTNTQEQWWCTDPLNPDSDGDGVSDGDEVQAAKDWLGNLRGSYPSTGKPFVGWPPDHTGCYDDDQDSIPDLAERWELGLNMNRESTDRDKFDDGQELFGNTKCPGYGALPRAVDEGIIFCEMPSWVKVPGNHPMVTAFPVPEIDVVESSLHVETVTVVTTDHTIGEGTERSYSTAKLEGTNTSVANTETWNEWQEVSESLQERVIGSFSFAALDVQSVLDNIKRKLVNAYNYQRAQAIARGGCTNQSGGLSFDFKPGGIGVGFSGEEELDPKYTGGRCEGVLRKAREISSQFAEEFPEEAKQYAREQHTYTQVDVRVDPVNEINLQNQIVLNNSFDTSNIAAGLEGLQYAYTQGAELIGQRLYEIAYILAAPVKTTTETRGNSWGGSQTTTTGQYEEHTITNGEAFSSQESWGTATAVDSSHAAELWFTYQVRNTGTEYAREIGDLAFNIYIGDDPNPAITYFVGPDLGGDGKFHNFMPDEEHTYTSRRIPLTLNQMAAVDLGGPVRIVVEDFTYGIDELFYEDAVNASVLAGIEDGTDDGDELIDTYLIPTWGEETVLDVLARYFPHTTDADGDLIAVWTPEQRADTPAWCNEPRRVGETLWCKHAFSTADWWNIYTDGLGDGSEGFQDTPAAPGSVALFRFNKDSDLDGYSDRSEIRLGTDPNDPADYPKPELIAGVHSIRSGDQVVATLSLLNTGFYDAYGVEAVMIAPDDSVSITNNTVGGSGRVRALKQVIVGSRILPPAYDDATWQGTAQPFSSGYYTGNVDQTYTFTAVDSGDVFTDTLVFNWTDGIGTTGTLSFPSGYPSPTPLDVGDYGVRLGLLSGSVNADDSFTVEARTPRDTFQYTINSEPYTEPVVIVSYNDPQGNHRFVTPLHLSTPTENLAPHSGKMLHGDADVEIVTQSPFDPEQANTTTLIAQAPVATRLVNAHLFLEFIDPEGTVVREEATTVTLETGPNVVDITWNPADFNPAYDPEQDYIVMAFFTDWQGNILDTAARPLSSFQEDPKPVFALDETATTWDFGAAPQGTLLEHTFTLANTGMMNLKATVVGAGVRTEQNVPGNPAWTDTGLDVAAGDAIGIRASGTVCYAGSGTTLCYGPDGSGEAAPGDWALPGASKFSLIARIGDGTPFFVGSTYVDIASSSGCLYLGTNDCNGTYGDNGGAYQAHIEIQGVPTSFQESPSFSVSPADATNLDVTLDTYYLPTGSFNRSILVRTSDPAYPTQTFQVQGTIESYVAPAQSMSVSPYRPWDQRVAVSGDREYREVVIFDDTITADATTVHPLRVYNDTRQTVLGVGKEIARAVASGGLAASSADETASLNTTSTGSVFGDGSDGDLTVSSGQTKYVDSVRTRMTSTASAGQKNVSVASTSGFPVGDEVLVIQMQGTGAGNYEFGTITSIGSGRLTLQDNLQHTYTVGGNSKAQVLRVPQYRNVTVQGGGTLTAHAWDGSTGGIVVFRCSGETTIMGTLGVAGKGFIGGTSSVGSAPGDGEHGKQGEGTSGPGGGKTKLRNGNGGGGGKGNEGGDGGGGGGNGSSGTAGNTRHNIGDGGQGGALSGNGTLTSITSGGAGGSGGGEGNSNSSSVSGAGGNGGGIIILHAKILEVNGSLNADGSAGGNATRMEEGSGGGGGGAGGSILVRTQQATIGSNKVRALGGSGGARGNPGHGSGDGGSGGVGRIRIEYCDTFSGSTNPTASVAKINFCYGTVSGKVFRDNNGNGVQDAGEPGLAGVTVSLSGVGSKSTGSDGSYSFTANAPANYTVSVTPPAGYDCVTSCSVNIALEVDRTTMVNFALRPRASILGKVFHDTNNNGVLDAGESGIGGVTVNLNTGPSRTTDSNGNYSFTDILPGNYTVSIVVPSGYANTTPTSRGVSLNPGDAATVNFGLLRRASITGKVFHDLNNNGSQNAGESGMGSVTVTLVGAGQSRTTASDGSYSFADLMPGNYSVSVSVPDGYVNTTPTTVSCNLGAGDTCTANFGILMYFIEKAAGSEHQIRLFMPESFHGGRRYWVQYGRSLDFTGAGEQEAHVKLPQVHYGEATMDVFLTEPVSSNVFVQINLDVGCDASSEWSVNSNLAIPTTLSTNNLAEGLNRFMDTATPDVEGLVTVPLCVSFNMVGHLYLTNLVATPDGISDVSIAPGDIVLNPTDPVEGDTVNVQATLHNASGYDTGGLTVSFFAAPPEGFGETYIGSDFVSNVSAGLTITATIQWNTLGFTGDVPVRVVADPYDRVAETDDDNNEATASLTVKTRPDLHITTWQLSDEEPVAGETITVTLTVTNAGETTAITQTVGFYQGNPEADGTPVGSDDRPPLSGATADVVTFTWTPAAPGAYRLFAVSDQDDAVNEFDEGNNQSWEDVYVGFAGPLLLDSGNLLADPVYTTTLGYGYLNLGTRIVTCGGSAPEATSRAAFTSTLYYRFDHLLPGHFYHLDLTLRDCDGSRAEEVTVNGMQVIPPVDLSDHQPHRLSILLDPALYRDRTITVGISETHGLDAMLAEISLHDVDYRYADAGHSDDLQDPADPKYPGHLAGKGRAYGWLDGEPLRTWGNLPSQTVRMDRADTDPTDDPDNELRYRFDGLDPARRYRLHLAFRQLSGATIIQKVQIDGTDASPSFNLDSGQAYSITLAVPLTAYQSDGSIVAGIVRMDCVTSEAQVNEIALEEETLPAGSPCHVIATPYRTIARGSVTIRGAAAPAGTVIQAVNPRDDVVGCTVVQTAGTYPNMQIYGEDPPSIPGMRDDEIIEFRINGIPAVATPSLYWHNDWTPYTINLAIGSTEGQCSYLGPGWNLISTRMEPPVPTAERVLRSVQGRYCRVLAETGIYDCNLDPVYRTLKELDPRQGYYLKLDGATGANMRIEGILLPVTTPLPLHTYWNWVSYLPTTTLSITTALQSIEGHYLMVLSRDKVYDPAHPEWSDLLTLEPGEGYLIRATDPVTLVYPSGVEVTSTSGSAHLIASTCPAVSPTPYRTLLRGSVTIHGTPAPVGTRVEIITPRGEVAGCTIVRYAGQYGYVHVYGEDSSTPPIPGFREGEPLAFRVDGQPALPSTAVAWGNDLEPHAVDLVVDSIQIYLPMVMK